MTLSSSSAEFDPLDAGVFERFADDAAVAAAHDEHRFGFRVGTERRVHHGFVVVAVVSAGHLRNGVEKQHLAEFVRVEELQRLDTRFLP